MNQLQQLMDICIAVAMTSDYDHLLDRILDAAMDIAQCEAGTLYLVKEELLTFAVMKNRCRGDLNGKDPDMPPIPLDSQKHMSTLALTQGVIRVDDAYTCSDYDLTGTYSYDQETGYHTSSVLMVPILTRIGEKIGVLQLINHLDPVSGEVCPFTNESIQITEALASQISIVLQNASDQEQMRLLKESVEALADSKVIPSPIRQGLSTYLKEKGQQKKEELSMYLGRTTSETAARLSSYATSREQTIQTLDLLQEKVWNSELSNAELSRRACINKGTLSNLINGKRTITKENLIPICIGLRLSLSDTTEMLAASGYLFRGSDRRDLVIQYFLQLNETAIHPYWVSDINDVLFEMGLLPLGSHIKE